VKAKFTSPDIAEGTKFESLEGNPAWLKMMGEK
jgi:hypothetical protein